MKCVRRNNEIVRVSDSDASELVKAGWKYCPKAEWKVKVRGEVKAAPKVEAEQEDAPEQSTKRPGKNKYRKRSAEEREAQKVEKSKERFKNRTNREQRSKESAEETVGDSK